VEITKARRSQRREMLHIGALHRELAQGDEDAAKKEGEHGIG